MQLAQSVAVDVAGCWPWSWSLPWSAALREVEPSARNWAVTLGHQHPVDEQTAARTKASVARPEQARRAGQAGWCRQDRQGRQDRPVQRWAVDLLQRLV